MNLMQQQRRSNLRAAVNKDDGGMLPAGDQVVWFVQHAVQFEARLPREAEDLWSSAVEWKTWEINSTYTINNILKILTQYDVVRICF